jgi:hypothetical protein
MRTIFLLPIVTFAENIIAEQQAEIAEIGRWLSARQAKALRHLILFL